MREDCVGGRGEGDGAAGRPTIRLPSAPTVSVVVVNHDYGRFLRRCLESVAGQDYPALECIVVDNASTDGSVGTYLSFLEALEEPTRSTFTLVEMGENVHQTLACRAGFLRSGGKLVCFVDADDYLLPGCVVAHVQAHVASAGNPGFSCGDMFQALDGEILSTRSPGVAAHVASTRSGARREDYARLRRDEALVPSALSRGLADLGEDLYPVEAGAGIPWPWSAMSAFCFRRDAVDMMFRREPDLRGNADAYLAHGISSLTTSVVVDRPLAVYCGHGANVFLRSAPLDGFLHYDPAKMRQELASVGREILRTHLANMESLADRVDGARRYFDALRCVCLLMHGRPEAAEAEFDGIVRAERDRLLACFGDLPDATGTSARKVAEGRRSLLPWRAPRRRSLGGGEAP